MSAHVYSNDSKATSSFKPITPDSPEPRLGHSPRALPVLPRALLDSPGTTLSSTTAAFSGQPHFSQGSGNCASHFELATCKAQQGSAEVYAASYISTDSMASEAGPCVHLASGVAPVDRADPSGRQNGRLHTHRSPVSLQHNSPASQGRRPDHVNSPSTQQAISPVRLAKCPGGINSPGGRAKSSSPSLPPHRPQHSPTSRLSPTSNALHAVAAVKAPSTKSPVKSWSKLTHTGKAPRSSKQTPQASIRVVPSWNSDFSIRYHDPVSIKDQERDQNMAGVTCMLPALPAVHKGKSKRPVKATAQSNCSARQQTGKPAGHAGAKNAAFPQQVARSQGASPEQVRPCISPCLCAWGAVCNMVDQALHNQLLPYLVTMCT